MMTMMTKYPELTKVANELATQVLQAINKQAPEIESEMPYKAQFILEEVIKILKSHV